MRTWEELLLNKEYAPEDSEPFGSTGHQVCAALDVTEGISWFTEVGSQTPSTRVVHLTSWTAVLASIHESWDAGFGGNLPAASELCSVAANDSLYSLYVRTYEESVKVLHFSPYLPKQLAEQERERLNSYVRSWCELLFCEILTSATIDCTYFREQLAWFYAGHFPCGWDGEWPVGKMRVF